jgi:diaminohydroxyphosphoribosylaminopyrimidine deaminase/5-amino-6-(5-phosphoribosylamino)uracil reductase
MVQSKKLWLLLLPKFIGGHNAPSPVGDLGFTKMTEAIELQQVTIKNIDPDILFEGYII